MKILSFVVMSVVGVVMLAVEPLGVPKTGVYADPVYRWYHLNAHCYD